MSIEAMKQALEALDLSHPRFGIGTAKHISATAALRQAIAELESQEPVAWMEMVVANLVREGVNKHKARELAQHFYTHPPQRTEPVIDKSAAIRIATALWWTPPKGNT